jgi:AraC-like DNA-binding protein
LTDVALRGWCTLDNALFAPEMLPVVGRPEAWRLVSTLCPPEVAPVVDLAHAEWMAGSSHAHPYRELLLVLGGEGRHGYLGRVFPLSPGTMFFFEAHEEHDTFWPPWAPPADHLWVGLIQDHFIARRVSVRDGRERPGGWQEVITADEAGLIGERAFGAPPGASWPPEVRAMRVRAAAAALVASLVARGYARPSGPGASPQERVIDAVRRHIAETAGHGASLDSLARLSGYSKYHFLRLFQCHTGVSVHAYIDRCRLERTRQMLADGHTQAEVADVLGFSCPSAFSRWYRPRRG